MSEVEKVNMEEMKPEKPSLFGMIWSPTEQFERIKERPLIWVPLAIISLLFIIGTLLTIFTTDLGLEQIPEEEMALIRIVAMVTGVIVGVIAPIFGALLSTVIYWIIIKIARTEATFQQLFSMNVYMMIIAAFSVIVNGIGYALLGGNPETLFTSLGWIIPADEVMSALYSSIEVFTIWGVILAAIGLHKVGGLSKGVAWTISIAFYVIGVAFAMIGAYIAGMFVV
ncbi:YIP1 family protein [Oceanobacillus salinisoli]|uniref:YIP1 family protein n=1 Tax=Oceanobacillus salinisoli TaxID=2678611 RepID=UPI0018CC31BD|nr:YIP1 family protein [Oceanobacillus salinisoli]